MCGGGGTALQRKVDASAASILTTAGSTVLSPRLPRLRSLRRKVKHPALITLSNAGGAWGTSAAQAGDALTPSRQRKLPTCLAVLISAVGAEVCGNWLTAGRNKGRNKGCSVLHLCLPVRDRLQPFLLT